MIEDRRDSYVTWISVLGMVLIVLTEVLSYFGAINRASVTVSWVLLGAAAFAWRVRAGNRAPRVTETADGRKVDASLDDRLYLWAFAGIAAVTLFLAVFSPPNHVDPTAYHLPRVLRWVQDGTLAPFPTHIDRQLWIGPGAEYFLLHAILLAGTDRVANLAQWGAFIGVLPVVAIIARDLGAGRRGQAFAMLFSVTLPIAIVQASGGHVDVFASFWLCTSAALLLRIRRRGPAKIRIMDAIALGAAIGVAILSKATNVLFLLPFLTWTVFSLGSVALENERRRAALFALARLSVLAVAVALAINAGPAYRNIAVWGSPLGNPAKYDLTNEVITPASVASNVIRNAALHFNWYSPAWNRRVQGLIEKVHSRLGIDVNDPRTTYESYGFYMSPKIEDEGASGDPLHVVLIAAALLIAARRKLREPLWFLGCVVAGAILFSGYLKWQPWGVRFHLPLFLVAAGAVGAVLEKAWSKRMLRILGATLVVSAMPALFNHARRPIISRTPVFTVPYERRLFVDDSVYNAYKKAADLVASRKCSRIGLMESEATAEYPLWKLMSARSKGKIEIRHVNVLNETRRLRPAADQDFRPCAVVGIYYYGEGPNFSAPPGFELAWKEGQVTVFFPN